MPRVRAARCAGAVRSARSCCSPRSSRSSAGWWPPRSAPPCSSPAAAPSASSSRSPDSCASPAFACVPSVAAAPVAVPESTPFEPIELAEPEADEHGWTPQPLPKPLHLSRGTIAAMAMASIEAAAELKRAAADAEVARRVEQLEPVVPSIVPAPAPAAGRRGIRSPGDRGREPLRAHGDRRRREPRIRRPRRRAASSPAGGLSRRRTGSNHPRGDGRLVLARAHGAVGSASRSQ